MTFALILLYDNQRI